MTDRSRTPNPLDEDEIQATPRTQRRRRVVTVHDDDDDDGYGHEDDKRDFQKNTRHDEEGIANVSTALQDFKARYYKSVATQTLTPPSQTISRAIPVSAYPTERAHVSPPALASAKRYTLFNRLELTQYRTPRLMSRPRPIPLSRENGLWRLH